MRTQHMKKNKIEQNYFTISLLLCLFYRTADKAQKFINSELFSHLLQIKKWLWEKF